MYKYFDHRDFNRFIIMCHHWDKLSKRRCTFREAITDIPGDLVVNDDIQLYETSNFTIKPKNNWKYLAMI